MQNNIPTLYILKLDSFVVKSAKISTILCLFVQSIKNADRIAMAQRIYTEIQLLGRKRNQLSNLHGRKLSKCAVERHSPPGFKHLG